ncbi:helix-turn-helix transcriptional regulator [Chamaesiphon polymorphus]|uniref:AraC family transcriptional regulator n=1 Tax=Chamaesiphon polymorphus CCALA 037 TaxID=2107692 RepID=A0A2T1GN82_9CYAN|nr:helix-turn-helix transcriptional regulator [Chamaesiphon polymorphus]PSB59370.1 AraC family transcriptional regulator [Chamaesiphon polymorphus CCALA 037]
MLTIAKPNIESKNRSLTHTQLQQVLDYIYAHLDSAADGIALRLPQRAFHQAEPTLRERELSLTELAKVINLSPTYFASTFKQATGISPHQYVIQQRVERAKSMLSKTDLTIADIALQVGFSSQSHLTQQFKRLTGITPKQIR